MFRNKRPPTKKPPPSGISNSDDHNGEDQERRILAAIDGLRDTTVKEVMTPRVDVVGLAIPVHARQILRAAGSTGHSSFPVYDDDLDHLIGVLFIHDLFRSGWDLDVADEPEDQNTSAANTEKDRRHRKPTPLDISRRIRQPYLVPESRLVLDVLADMRRDRRAFAVVVDEYGGVAGVLTVKDLLGALVGDLRDEFAGGEEPDVIRVDRTRWLVDGGTSVDDLRSGLGIDLPDGEYVTLGGFLFDAFGHIPVEGEKIVHNGWEFRVAEMDKRRVAKVVVQAPAEDQEPASAEVSS